MSYAAGTAAADIARLRRMVAEPGTATYTDALLVNMVSGYPLPDATGEWPLTVDGSVNTDWTPTYDLAAAAASVWGEKAAALAGAFDFTADGATFHKSQAVEQYERQARLWRSRRAPGNHEMLVYPAQTARSLWIGNLAEDD